jgi:Uma2 family endonuclease
MVIEGGRGRERQMEGVRMSAVSTPLITAEEFGRRPEPADGSKEELVKGMIVTIPPPKALHGLTQTLIASLLLGFVRPRRLGWVATESGTVLESDPDTIRGPDVAFYSITHLPAPPIDYFEIAPDLVVEVLSPDDRRSRVRDKIREYISAGVRLVWLVDPETRTVLEYRGSLRGTEYDESDTITGADVLPDFSCRVAELFP